MTAQPVDPQQADSRRIAETTAPAAWLKSALSPWRRLMSLGGALVIADTVPAIGFAAGLALAVGALPPGLAEAVPGLILATVALIARAALNQGAVFVNTRAARAAKNGLRRRALKGASWFRRAQRYVSATVFIGLGLATALAGSRRSA